MTNTRRELDNQQAEKARIEYAELVMPDYILLTYDLFRKLHVEADEKLQNIYHQLLQAGADRHESDREAKLKETLASLQGIFPGPSIFSFSFGYDSKISSFPSQEFVVESLTCVNLSSGNMKLQYQLYSAVISTLLSSMKKKQPLTVLR